MELLEHAVTVTIIYDRKGKICISDVDVDNDGNYEPKEEKSDKDDK